MRDTGTLNQCNIGEPCEIRNARLDLFITVTVDRVANWQADIRIAHRGACCLFGGGDDSRHADVRQDLIRVPIYEGKRRLGNEFVQNNPTCAVHQSRQLSEALQTRPSTGCHGRF